MIMYYMRAGTLSFSRRPEKKVILYKTVIIHTCTDQIPIYNIIIMKLLITDIFDVLTLFCSNNFYRPIEIHKVLITIYV